MLKRFFALFILMFFSLINLFAQSKEDILLLKEHNFENKNFDKREVVYGFGHNNSKSPIYHVFSASMFVYQKCLSAVVSRSCAFTPSCSAYSKALIKEYGLFKGIICTTDRLMRCNRIAIAGKSPTYFDMHNGKHFENILIYSSKQSKE